MSRSGLSEDEGDDNWAHIRWRGMVASATRGRRGQRFLSELRDALDAMPVKELIAQDLQTPTGEVCALGALGTRQGKDLSNIDPDNHGEVAGLFDVAECLAQEVMWENDECSKFTFVKHRCSICHGWGEVAGKGGYPRRCNRCSRGFTCTAVDETPAQRWVRMREWVDNQIKRES